MLNEPWDSEVAQPCGVCIFRGRGNSEETEQRKHTAAVAVVLFALSLTFKRIPLQPIKEVCVCIRVCVTASTFVPLHASQLEFSKWVEPTFLGSLSSRLQPLTTHEIFNVPHSNLSLSLPLSLLHTQTHSDIFLSVILADSHWMKCPFKPPLIFQECKWGYPPRPLLHIHILHHTQLLNISIFFFPVERFRVTNTLFWVWVCTEVAGYKFDTRPIGSCRLFNQQWWIFDGVAAGKRWPTLSSLSKSMCTEEDIQYLRMEGGQALSLSLCLCDVKCPHSSCTKNCIVYMWREFNLWRWRVSKTEVV